MRAAPVGRLRTGALALFSSPMIVFQAIETPWRLYMPAFLTEHVGLSLAAVAALMLWIRLFDMLAEPVLGVASDRTVTRFGRRRPWMVLSVPLIVLGASQLFFADPGDGVVTVVLAALLLHLGHMMLVTPHGGWGLELATSPAESARIMGAKMWAFAASVPLTLSVPALVERWAAGGLATQVGAMGALVMASAPLAVLATVALVREPVAAIRASRGGVRHGIAAAMRDPALRGVLLLYAMLGAADAAEGATTLFFIEQRLEIRGWTSSLLLVPALVGLMTIPLWTALGMRFDKRRVLAWAFALRALVAPFALLLPAEQLAPLLLYLVARCLCWGADYLLLRAMVADLVAARRSETGEGHAATHYAVFNVANKLAAALGVGGALGMLQVMGFVPGAPSAPGAGPVLSALYALPSCVVGLLGLWVLRRR